MFYFERQCSNMGSVWGLFSGLGEESYREEILMEDRRCDYSHIPDIVHSAMNGNILSSGEFNLRAYEIACLITDEIESGKRRSKILTIKDDINSDDATESKVGYGEISINDRRLELIDEAFDIIENNEVFEEYMKDLLNLRKDYIVEGGLDILELIKSSLRGIPDAVKEISKITSDDDVLRDIISSLCLNSDDSLQARLEGAF